MKHSDIRLNLSAYLDDSLPPAERTVIEEHLESCRECRADLEELKKTREYVRDVEEVEPPAWLAGKIMARARDEAARKESFFRRLFFPLHVKLPIEAAALVLVTVTGYLVFRVSQPEMGMVGTAMKEESGKAAPSASAPSAPPAPAPAEKRGKEKSAAVREGEKALSLKPQPVPMEKELPPAATESGFAPAPTARAVPPGFESSDTIREKASPSLQEERSMGAQGISGEGKSEAESNRLAKRKAMPQPEKIEAKVSFLLRSPDRASLGIDIEHLVARLGGRIVKREWSDERRAYTVVLEGGKLDLFREKLGSFGELTVRGKSTGYLDRNGETTVLLEVQAE